MTPGSPASDAPDRRFSMVLDSVLTYGAERLNQKQIADLTGVSESIVSLSTRPRWGHGPMLSSRPVRFSPQMGLVLSVSVGAERVRAALIDANGEPLHAKSTEPMRDLLGLDQRELLNRVRVLAARVLEEALEDDALRGDDKTLPILAAAMALPTPVDRDHRQVNNALSHPSWRERRPYETLNHAFAAALGTPFAAAQAQVMNDCNAASVAVAFDRVRIVETPRKSIDDAFRERATAMVIRVGGGVGVGIIEVASDPDQVHVSRFLKSRVMVGTHGLAGEIGHLPIAESVVTNLNTRSADIPGLAPIDYAAPCACAQRHHLQGLVNGNAIAQRLSLPVAETDTPLSWLLEDYLAPQPEGDNQAATRALEDAGRLIGRALTGSVLALDLKAITVIGALARPALVEGLGKARTEWADAFWTGSKVEMVPPQNDPTLTIARGAGLALLREHRHRRFREIGRGLMREQTPLLPIGRGFVSRLRTR